MAGPLGETTPGMAGYGGTAGYASLDALTVAPADVDPADEGATVIGNTIASQPLNVASKAEAAFDMTLHVATTTLSLTNVPAGSVRLLLVVHQDTTGGRLVTWPASFKWAGGTAPTLTITGSGTDVIVAESADGGTTFYAREVVAAAA